MEVYAQTLGKIEVENKPELGTVVTNLLMVAFLAAGIFFLVQVILGGISWIGAGGDPKALDSARSRITNAVIGLVIVVASVAIATIVTSALGINIFTGNEIKIGG
jgi:hypothetical protein